MPPSYAYNSQVISGRLADVFSFKLYQVHRVILLSRCSQYRKLRRFGVVFAPTEARCLSPGDFPLLCITLIMSGRERNTKNIGQKG